MRKTGWVVSSGIESADVKELHQSDSGPVPRQRNEEAVRPGKSPMGFRTVKAGLHTAVVLCLVTALVHVVLVFLHVAPSNPVSTRYSSQVNGWVFPLFEQNWRLFAPDPDSFNRKILARTAHTDSEGSVQVTPGSTWLPWTIPQSTTMHFRATRPRTFCAAPGPPTSRHTEEATPLARNGP